MSGVAYGETWETGTGPLTGSLPAIPIRQRYSETAYAMGGSQKTTGGMETRRRVQVHVPYPILLERFDEVIARRINPEIYLDGEHLETAGASDLDHIRNACSKHGLRITMHGPYAELNPGSADEKTRLFTVERYERLFEAVSHLLPETVVLHAGYHERKFRGDSALWLSQSLKTWPRFVERAAALGVVIAVENIFEKEPSTLRALIEAVASPHLMACLDSGHLNVFSKVAMQRWFDELGPRLAVVHLHDNNGVADDHLPVGEGGIDFDLFFSLLDACASDPVRTIEPHGEEVLKRALRAIGRYL